MEGHLLALFGPANLNALEAFANPDKLKLVRVSDTEQRSSRSLLDLVDEIARVGGLAIPAHVDAADGINEKLQPSALADLLRHSGLAGLEFAKSEALKEWFTDSDPNPHRRTAWKARQAVDELRERGLWRGVFKHRLHQCVSGSTESAPPSSGTRLTISTPR